MRLTRMKLYYSPSGHSSLWDCISTPLVLFTFWPLNALSLYYSSSGHSSLWDCVSTTDHCESVFISIWYYTPSGHSTLRDDPHGYTALSSDGTDLDVTIIARYTRMIIFPLWSPNPLRLGYSPSDPSSRRDCSSTLLVLFIFWSLDALRCHRRIYSTALKQEKSESHHHGAIAYDLQHTYTPTDTHIHTRALRQPSPASLRTATRALRHMNSTCRQLTDTKDDMQQYTALSLSTRSLHIFIIVPLPDTDTRTQTHTHTHPRP